ncbi:hypothetical protein DMENIID0001_115300 [Sergentomyia squamirostris]
MKILWILFFAFFVRVKAQVLEEEDFSKHIDFIVFQNNQPFNTSLMASKNPVELGLCNEGDKLAVFTHGWTKNCSDPWVVGMVDMLTKHRGGCIICMDYSYYGNNQNYAIVVAQFPKIRDVLYDQMVNYGSYGFSPSNTYMYGHSYGAHLVLDAAANLGTQVIKEIDVCDPAGIGFLPLSDPKLSAQNVQCIHTSSLVKGSIWRDCHQDWNMGICAIIQEGTGSFLGLGLENGEMNSHARCPYVYNSAFENNFPAIPKPLVCVLLNPLILNLATYPANFKMGYMETRKQQVSGNLYAKTSGSYPYN